MLTKDIRHFDYVVFDLETTGFNPEFDQIIEIGAVKLNGKGEVIAKFQKFIKLYKQEKLSEKIIDLTNITDDMLEAGGEDIEVAMEQFHKFFKDSILVAQNTKFDMSFLDEYFLKEKSLFLENLTFDTIDLSKNIFPNKKSYKLASLIEYFEIEYDSNAHHRADYDAEITSQIFVKGMKELFAKRKEKIEDYLDVFNIEEATINQKRYLHTLLKNSEIILEKKVYLSKFNASRQIGILSTKNY